MDRKTAAASQAMRTPKVKLDPGNLMLVVYTLVIALILLFGGLLQADGSVQPADKPEAFRLMNLR